MSLLGESCVKINKIRLFLKWRYSTEHIAVGKHSKYTHVKLINEL